MCLHAFVMYNSAPQLLSRSSKYKVKNLQNISLCNVDPTFPVSLFRLLKFRSCGSKMANPYALEVVRHVANVTDTAVHIVFVPGIEVQSLPTLENNNHPPVHWIKDLLPTDLPTATILKFRYKNNLTWTRHSIENHGKNLLLELNQFRASRGEVSRDLFVTYLGSYMCNDLVIAGFSKHISFN